MEPERVGAELGAQLHLLGRLLHLVGHLSEEEEGPRGCNGEQLWEMTRRRAAEVQSQSASILELVADVQRVVFR